MAMMVRFAIRRGKKQAAIFFGGDGDAGPAGTRARKNRVQWF